MVWGLTHLTASDYRLDKTLKVLRLLRLLECAASFVPSLTDYRLERFLKVLRVLRFAECVDKGLCII